MKNLMLVTSLLLLPGSCIKADAPVPVAAVSTEDRLARCEQLIKSLESRLEPVEKWKQEKERLEEQGKYVGYIALVFIGTVCLYGFFK